MRTKFIAVDGEGITDDDGVHHYVMLCASTGDYVINAEGLSTVQCFEFLLTLKRKYPEHKLVGFAFNYDVNMMLRDVPRVQLERLWKDRESNCILANGEMYILKWIPTKFFEVRADTSVAVNDTFGFFQMSFLRALQDWKVEDRNGALARIVEGKAGRGTFSTADLSEMKHYCITECIMLVDLCEKLQDSLELAGLKVTKWIGAGAVGQAMIKKYDVLKHHVPDWSYPESLRNAIMHAYFGGRFEMFRQGYFPSCYNYDIISAYPYQCTNLPSLQGEWKEVASYDTDARYSLWLVEWDLQSKNPLVCPFPYRHKDGNIYYPVRGMGWYWGNEVRSAFAMHREGITVKRGYVFTPQDNTKPFAFLNEIWEERKKAKALGLASQKAYKLGMNSLYGKLAQGKGYQGQIPKQRSFVWAGMICSNTRALLLDLMNGNEDKVIAVATDGLFFSDDPHFDTSTDLGGLELNECEDWYQFLNGIYYSPNTKVRTRGHHPGEVDWDRVISEWTEHKMFGKYIYPATRFIGLGQALMLKDFSKWRRWIEGTREINLHQFFRKWTDEGLIGQQTIEQECVEWWPSDLGTPKLGRIYEPKTDIVSAKTQEQRQAVLEWLELFDQPQIMMEG